uniref:Uncharacterized protein n=1 Tax=Anguilla anguilla TaxID=7936 RepID=A0A0E9S0E4_ANGAN
MSTFLHCSGDKLKRSRPKCLCVVSIYLIIV